MNLNQEPLTSEVSDRRRSGGAETVGDGSPARSPGAATSDTDAGATGSAEVLEPKVLEHWRRITGELHGSGRAAAEESERWFLAAVRRAENYAHWLEAGVDAAAYRLYLRARKHGWRRLSARERIERALRAEVRRTRASVDPEEFSEFSARMAALVDLVLRGALPLSSIAFEEDDGAPEPEYAADPSATAE